MLNSDRPTSTWLSWVPTHTRRPRTRRWTPELLQALADQGQIVRVNEDVVYLKSAYEEMAARVIELARANGEVTISDVRELFSTSRKYTLALLEHMDRLQVTRRVGDNRVLR